jgi:hypothetical protein
VQEDWLTTSLPHLSFSKVINLFFIVSYLGAEVIMYYHRVTRHSKGRSSRSTKRDWYDVFFFYYNMVSRDLEIE